MRNLTERQREVLDFVSHFIEEQSYPPTVREIGNHFNISVRAVQDHILALQKKGFIGQDQKKARSFKILKTYKEKSDEPLMKRIPVLKSFLTKDFLSADNIKDYILLSEFFINSDEQYFIVENQNTYYLIEVSNELSLEKPNAIVLDNALVFGNVSLEDNRYKLDFIFPSKSPLYIQEVNVIGRLKGVFQKY